MWLTIDNNSEVAVYMQLYNQIVEAIAMDMISEGEMLPSVRQMAEIVGINMHTVNKTYAILREEGYITLDRRGARVSIDVDKLEAMENVALNMRTPVAKALCSDVSAEELHMILDGVINELKSK